MLACLVAVTFASCGTKKYDENLSKAYASAKICFEGSAVIIDNTASVWRNAIYNNRDSHGQYCYDFNDALKTLFSDYKEKDIFSTIDEYQSEMKLAMGNLVNAPKSRKDAYDDLLEIATEVNMLIEMAEDPSGSLQSYRDQTNELAFELKKKLDAFELKYGSILIKSIVDESLND